MTHTVIGLFDNRTEAQAAMQELIQNGFARESIDVSNRSASSSTTTTNQTSSTTADSGNSVSNFFNSLFGPDSTEARTYSNVASDTEGIVTVQTDSEEKARVAAEILDRNGAVDVDERGSQYQQNFVQTSGTTQNQTTNQTTNQADMTIPVIEEDLQIGKRTVEQGGVRVRSRIIEKPVEETIRLREEHVVVNRHPVNRAVTDSDFSTFKEGEMEITERAEQAVVSKQARVVEEVSIGKQVEERDQVVSDTVRRTDVEVEEVDADINTRTATNR
jgi:uncharacterized protein (TIGR02271 family)